MLPLEAWLIFKLLGLDGTFLQVATVTAVLTASAAILFVIPGQIGVNEVGIVAVFPLLGLPAHLGLAFALLRRARQTFWPLLGITVHGAVFGSRRIAQLNFIQPFCPAQSAFPGPEAPSQDRRSLPAGHGGPGRPPNQALLADPVQ